MSEIEKNESDNLDLNVASTTKDGKLKKYIKEAWSFAWIIILVFAFRSTFFEPFRIPSGSMIPTLMIGDFILVNKMSYGIKVPFSDWFSDPVYLYQFDGPKRGDVIVFKYPKDPSTDYIKRAIAIPGDTVEIKNKIVYVNDKPIEVTKIDGKAIMDDMDDKFKDYKLDFYSAKHGEHQFTLMVDTENYYKVDMPKRVVPKGKYFVMGDNRDFSYDSRYWGFVPFENIKGQAILVWFSLILPFDEAAVKFRPWRIGTMIH